MNPLTALPNEILFQCVQGSPVTHLNRPYIRNFLKLKAICTSLTPRIDECWKMCLGALWEDWKSRPELENLSKEQFILKQFPSFRFVLNWIDGKPKITKTTLIDALKNDFGLEIKPEDELKVRKISPIWHSIPVHVVTKGNIVAYAKSSSLGDISFINLATKKFLGEIEGTCTNPGYNKIQFHHPVVPIIHENHAFVLVYTNKGSELWHYAIGSDCILFKKSVSLTDKGSISMHLVEAHIIFWSGNFQISQFSAISIDDLIHLNTPPVIESNNLINYFQPQKCDTTLLIQSKKGLNIFHQTITVKDQKIEFNDLTDMERQLYKKEIYPALNIHIPRGVTPKHPIKFKDASLLMQNIDHRKIKMETVTIRDGQVELMPMDIFDSVEYDFQFSVFHCHLDKLFLIGYLRNDAFGFEPYLLILNLHSKVVEHKHPIDIFDNYPAVELIETSPGCILVFNRRAETIYKIDYTS